MLLVIKRNGLFVSIYHLQNHFSHLNPVAKIPPPIAPLSVTTAALQITKTFFMVKSSQRPLALDRGKEKRKACHHTVRMCTTKAKDRTNYKLPSLLYLHVQHKTWSPPRYLLYDSIVADVLNASRFTYSITIRTRDVTKGMYMSLTWMQASTFLL